MNTQRIRIAQCIPIICLTPFISEHLRVLDEITQPAYHFFAHHGDPIDTALIGNTMCCWLDDAAFAKQSKIDARPINPGCMGILKWQDRSSNDFEIVEAPWFTSLTNRNWQTWSPQN